MKRKDNKPTQLDLFKTKEEAQIKIMAERQEKRKDMSATERICADQHARTLAEFAAPDSEQVKENYALAIAKYKDQKPGEEEDYKEWLSHKTLNFTRATNAIKRQQWHYHDKRSETRTPSDQDKGTTR